MAQHAYDTSPSGIAGAGRKGEEILRDAKAGSPLGASGTYSDAKNAAEPQAPGTINRNFVNTHQNSGGLAGSTGDTGRKQP